ncbi:MAG TPA: hypothetical protein VIY49_01160 [Bryobacteraceae bacterium]
MQTTYALRISLHTLSLGLAFFALNLSGAAPTITAVQNNYSYLIPGTPNYAIAPGALFILKGTGMAAAGTQPQLWNLSQGPLPLTSPAANGTSVSVTVGTTNVNCGIYYVSPTQVAAVLPSTTPTGSATFTITYNGQSGSISNIPIGTSAMGLDTLYPIAVGEAVATDNTTGNLITYAASASWNEVVVLWGSGLGGDTANDDRSYPAHQDNLSYLSALYVGGVQAQILYQGRSQYPGVDQVDIVIPTGVSGCFVGITAVSGSGAAQVVSSTVTLPVEQNGGACSDSNLSVTATLFTMLENLPSVRTAVIQMNERLTATGAYAGPASANGTFFNGSAGQYGDGYGSASYGSCFVSEPITVPPGGFNGGSTYLNAGTLTVTGASPSPFAVPAVQQGVYQGIFGANYTFPSGQSFSASNGNGAASVGGFSVTFPAPSAPLVWTNPPATVTRSQGVTVNWTGGDPTADVEISGTYSTATLTMFFNCYAPVSAHTFTVPSYITLSIPSGNGYLTLIQGTQPVLFSATGLDYGYAFVSEMTQSAVAFQ